MASHLKDLDENDLKEIIEKYGEPECRHFSADFLEFECEFVRKSAKKGRTHDITCFIKDGSDYVVIQKHAYANSGIFRAPSGGANYGESIEFAAKREMQEETGLEIRLIRFVLDLTLDVKCEEGIIPWRSLVFLAEPVGGEMVPLDTFEIYEVRRMTRENLLSDVENRMIESGWGGFQYRAYLQRTFFELMDRMGLES